GARRPPPWPRPGDRRRCSRQSRVLGDHGFAATTERGVLLLLLDRPRLERLGFGDTFHPLAELVLIVQQIGDADLGVLELRAPEEGVEGADLDADAAVHAEGVVDVEAVEGVDGAGLAPFAAGRRLLLVALS